MTQSYQLEELDDASRDYLRAVSRGQGMSGIFIKGSSWYPALGIIFGCSLLFILLIWYALGLYRDDPLAVACIQTAFLGLGSWLILAAIRTWVAQSQGSNLGHFVYADALHLWVVKGTSITVVDLQDLYR